MPDLPLKIIVSGGQTGADRAALDVALELGMTGEGWCPKGRRVEDGEVDERYPLKETPRADYIQRTEWNIRDSDGTLIVAQPPLEGGTAATARIAAKLGKPCLVLHPDDQINAPDRLSLWIHIHRIKILNVAGPRQSSGLDPYEATERLLRGLLKVR